MTEIMFIPSLLKILIVFAGILALVRFRVPLWTGLVVGGVAIDLWAGRTGEVFLQDTITALNNPDLWLLVIITALITEFGRYLSEEQNAQAFLTLARRLGGRHGRAAGLMALPALIGLVPMPGGALFSAPLVEQAARGTDKTPAWKGAVNYWFRHVWEYWWPLYPVVIVSIPIFEIEMWRFMMVMIPFSVLAIISGFFFLIRPHLTTLELGDEKESEAQRPVARVLIPLGIVLLAAIWWPHLIHQYGPPLPGSTTKMLGLLAGLIVALMTLLFLERKQKHHRLFEGFFEKKSLNVLAVLGGVMMFQSYLDSSGLIPLAGTNLIQSGIPVVLIIALLPFIAGWVTGIAIGYAGTAFPVVAGLVAQPELNWTTSAGLALAFGFGYAGMMLSPVHLCLVLTREFFDAPLRGIYRAILPCVIALICASLLFSFWWR